MKNSFKHIVLLLLVFFAVSCEKDIEIDLPDPEEKIVVEGWIESGNVAHVILTKNSPYFSKVDSVALAKLIITDAKITVSDGTNTEQLILEFNLNYFPPLMYKGSTIKGEIGKTYSITIEAEGKTLTSETSILPPYPFDSIWWEPEPEKGDTLGLVWAQFTDPPEIGNYYRLFSKRIGRDDKYVPLLGSIYDDKFFNGQTLIFSMFRGLENFSDETQFEGENEHEVGYFKKGDTIVIKSGSIDKAHYDFWRTAEQEMYTGENPFTTPTQIKSNINGGLGVWGGYGVVLDTIVAK